MTNELQFTKNVAESITALTDLVSMVRERLDLLTARVTDAEDDLYDLKDRVETCESNLDVIQESANFARVAVGDLRRDLESQVADLETALEEHKPSA
jgi:chromosome segregation ATPase